MKNYKNILFALTLLFGVAAVSCSCDGGADCADSRPTDTPGKLEFDISVDNGNGQTRAVAYDDDLFTGSFKLYAFSRNGGNADGTPKFINGDEVEVNAGKVTYDKSWPADLSSNNQCKFVALVGVNGAGPYNFMLITPSDKGSGGTDNMELYYFVHEALAANQRDIMCAVSPSYVYNDVIKLNFEHIMTRISFMARKDSSLDGKDVQISNIELEGARVEQNVKIWVGETPHRIEWVQEFDNPRSYPSVMDFPATDRQSLTTTYAHLKPEGEAADLAGSSNNMFLAPQADLTGAKLHVKMYIDGILEKRTIDIGSVSYSTPEPWPMGKHVVYQITIKPEATTRSASGDDIDVDVVSSLVAWDEADLEEALQ